MKTFLIASATVSLLFTSLTSASPLDFLYGHWEGTGTKGATVRTSTECNYPKFDGKIGIIQARYVENESKKVIGEFGILSPVDNNGTYKFVMYRDDGSTLEAVAHVDGVKQTGLLEFSIPPQKPGAPTMNVKYTITVVGDHWLEIGEISTDNGVIWKKIYEMNLKKMSETCQNL
ncbi:MAG: hypothetical protein H7061_06495 [Bdellovibrionaceae bacterium]|nr:hypothetical protein [Bdellovibrio sp.]